MTAVLLMKNSWTCIGDGTVMSVREGRGSEGGAEGRKGIQKRIEGRYGKKKGDQGKGCGKVRGRFEGGVVSGQK